MLFDQACGLVERHFPEWRDLMTRAAIFKLDLDPNEPTEGFDEDQIACLNASFFLPFPAVAVEDQRSVFVLEDTRLRRKLPRARVGDP